MRHFLITAAIAGFALLLVTGCPDDKEKDFPHATCPVPEISEAYRYCVSQDGGTVEIHGTNLGGDATLTADDVRVTIGTTEATSVTVAATWDLLTATFPSMSVVGEQTLTVTNVCSGSDASGSGVAVVTPTLQVTEIEPQYESPCGGAAVNIHGAGFVEGMSITVVPTAIDFFSSFTVASSNLIQGVLATNPYDGGEMVSVRVEYIYEGCTVAAEGSYTYDQVECDPVESEFAEIDAPDGYQVVGIGDFNNDGNNDVVVAYFDRTSVTVFEGAGDGTFSSEYDLALSSGDQAIALDVADINGDGLDDVALAVQGNDDAVSLLQSAGALVVHDVRGEIGGKPVDIVAAHLNGDDHMDVTTVSTEDNLVSFMFGDGTGGFPTFTGAPIQYGVALAAGDTDSDNLTHLYMATASADDGTSGVTAIVNATSGGTYAYSTSRTTTWTKPRDLIYFDTSFKSGPEVITADGSGNSVSFLSDFTDGVPAAVESRAFSNSPFLLAGGRFVDSGDAAQLVVLMTDASSGALQLLATVPDKSGALYFSGVPVSIATGDLDGDDLDDVVIGRASAGEILILFSSE